MDDILWPMVRAKIKVLGEVVEGNGSMDMSLNRGDPVRLRSSSFQTILILINLKLTLPII